MKNNEWRWKPTADRNENSGLMAGMRGLAQGYDPNMLDVISMFFESWKMCLIWQIHSVGLKRKYFPTLWGQTS